MAISDGSYVNYPFALMGQGAADIDANRREVERLWDELQGKVQVMMSVWVSPQAQPQAQAVNSEMTQTHAVITQWTGQRGLKLDDAALRMRQADINAGNVLDV